MTRILCIETATPVCSAALAENGNAIATRQEHKPNAHSEKLTPFIHEMLDGTKPDAVAVSKGPGSYTGLRIGVSVAKGLCYAMDIPLISIGTLESMARGMNMEYRGEKKELLFCPMIDARRMEVYCAVYCNNLVPIRETKAEVITKDSFSGLLSSYRILFFGNGASKCRDTIVHPHALFDEDFQPSAAHMAMAVHHKYEKEDFEDVAYFEPFYLKDFIAGEPKVKGL